MESGPISGIAHDKGITKAWIMGTALALIVTLVGGAITYGRMLERIDVNRAMINDIGEVQDELQEIATVVELLHSDIAFLKVRAQKEDETLQRRLEEYEDRLRRGMERFLPDDDRSEAIPHSRRLATDETVPPRYLQVRP